MQTFKEKSALFVCALMLANLLGASGSAQSSTEELPEDWSINTSSTPTGIVKSVEAMTSGVYKSGTDIDLIFLNFKCTDGVVTISMDRTFAEKSRLFDATFYKNYETAEVKTIRTYWRVDEGQREGVYDGSAEELFNEIGDGSFDVLVEGERHQQRLFSFDVQNSKLAFSRVKAACSSVD